MKGIRKKLKTSSGFTLAEVLVAILILLMVTSIVTGGIPAAKNAYENVVIASNAEVLMSTTIGALRNELGTANDVKTDEDNTTAVTYYNESINAYSKIFVENDKIMYQRYADSGMNKEGESAPLISDQAATQGLRAKYDSVEYSNGIVTFIGLQVERPGNTAAGPRDVSIRVISD